MAKIMSVQVKKCQLRNNPSFLGKVLSRLKYGEKVEVVKEENSWAEVSSAKNQAGWVHISALSKKEIIVNPDSKDIETAASSDEIALAGKGFNEQVEKNYRQKNKKVDFAWVDKMEKFVVSVEEMRAFLDDGGVSPEGGDA